jgi:Transposase
VGTIPENPGGMSSAVQDHLGQVSRTQHANDAVDELRRAEFFRQGPKKPGLIKGKKWLLLSRWKDLTYAHRGKLNRPFGLNRRVFRAYLLKESLKRLWDFHYEGAMFNYLQR